MPFPVLVFLPEHAANQDANGKLSYLWTSKVSFISPQEAEVAPIIADYWERAEFPHQIIPGMAQLNIASSTVEGYGAPGLTVVGAAMAAVETARVDGSVSTFILVHGSLCCLTIGDSRGSKS